MKSLSDEGVGNWMKFVRAVLQLREIYPEHAREIDRCIYDVGQKLQSCSDPDCNCKMSFEEFHTQTNHEIEIKLREQSYELN